MNKQLPVVTIIIPNYNHKDYFVEALDSIVKQDYPNKQIVFVDDASTDDSFTKLKEMMNVTGDLKHPEEVVDAIYGQYNSINTIAMKLRDNHGVAYARNIAIKTVWEHTHIFAFLDADDMYEPTKISKSVTKFLEYPNEIGVVYSDYIEQNDINNTSIPKFHESFDRLKLLKTCILNNDSLISKLALEQCGLYDQSFNTCEDYDLWIRLSKKFMFIHLPQCLVYVRISKNNLTSRVSPEEWNNNWSKVKENALYRTG